MSSIRAPRATSCQALVLVAALAGCAVPGTPHGPRPAAGPSSSAAIELDPGQRIVLSGGNTVRYVAIVSDSRCPIGVECIHAGEAVLRFELGAYGNASSFELSTAPPRDVAIVEGLRVRLLDATRDAPPGAHLSVDRAD